MLRRYYFGNREKYFEDQSDTVGIISSWGWESAIKKFQQYQFANLDHQSLH